MQRSRLTTVLASLGLGACGPEPAPTVEPEPHASLTSGGEEPSGLSSEPKPPRASASRPSEPRFEGVPLEFCHATFEQHDRPLLRTQSFLQAWNELAPTIHNPHAHNIPATEIDARVALCGAERCSLDTAKLAEANADYMVGVGVLLPEGDAMLVVPEVARAHAAAPCTDQTEISVERRDELVHIRALTRERRYTYGHYHGYGYGPHKELIPLECRTYSTHRRDLLIDAARGELELVIDQQQAGEDPRPWVEVELAKGGIVLRGCDGSMPLQWTE
ncbi:MAG: hypothetical protein R6X02_35520 [Enhygromyxa sp.]